MTITDYALNPIDPSSVSFVGHRTATLEVFPHDIYSFLIHSVRELDMAEGDELILRWLASAQSEWEDLYDRIKSLSTLVDPAAAPSEALQYLKWIVGFTAKLDFVTGGLADGELRLLISAAARMWKFKGTDLGLADVLRAVTARPVRILDWFYFRMIVGEFELAPALLDVDPWLIDVPGMQPSIPPDAVVVTEVADMTVLPSAADPPWTYVDEGEATEGNIFNVSGGVLTQDQSNGDPYGGRYVLNYPPSGVSQYNAQMAASWKLQDDTEVNGYPWHLMIGDGVKRYVLAWDTNVLVLEDYDGVTVAGPVPAPFVLGGTYALRIYKPDAWTVRAEVDGVDLFGPVNTVTHFIPHAVQQYGFGYRNRGLNQQWDVRWDNVGPEPQLNFSLATLLGTTEAVPHRIRVRYTPENAVRTVWSFWDGSTNRCHVSDGFGLDAPLPVTLDDFLVGVDPDEYVSDIRLMDENGTLNRELVENLVSVLRPSGERYFVRYLDFMDNFRRTFDWLLDSGAVSSVPAEGYADLEHASEVSIIKTDIDGDSAWALPQAAVQLSVRDVTAGKWAEMRFNYVDINNFYAVRLDAEAQEVSLRRVTSGVPTVLHTYGSPYVLRANVPYLVAVHTEDAGGGDLFIQYILDGNFLGEATDSDHPAGKLAVAAAIGQRVRVHFAELYQDPLESGRVGPP